MRRFKILFFWIFVNRNNVGFFEMLRFLCKPTISMTAGKNIKSIEKKDDLEVAFNTIPQTLHWPATFSEMRLNQVISETFDTNDWHYYQKQHTEVEQGERLLDIGTAEGLFPLTVIDKCEKVYMVEPSKKFVRCLERTFEDYRDKIEIFHVAVGNEDAVIPFDENSIEGTVTKSASDQTYDIAINKIDSILSENQKVTYLKADIEGFEQEMLRGAEQTIKRNKPKIAITTYHTQNDPQEIISIIKGFVPEYKHYVKGIFEETPKPVMIHFWI